MSKLEVSVSRENAIATEAPPELDALNAALIASIEMQKLPSALLLRRFHNTFAIAKADKVAVIADAKAVQKGEVIKAFMRLMALSGTPVVIDADRKPDFLASLRARADASTTTSKS